MDLINGQLPWQNEGVRVAIIGDLILDEYLEGHVQRISPEAPVPVHLVKGRRFAAGGAANVARNVQLAGGKAILFGVLGRDEAADQLKAILNEDGVDISLLLEDRNRPTIRKTRVTASRQQMMRIDWEKSVAVASSMQEELLRRLEGSSFDVIILSDYAKGCLTDDFIKVLIAYGKKAGKPVIVDPKGLDYRPYAGASLITPNRAEALAALGLAPDAAQKGEVLAQSLKENFDLDEVLVTLGGEGMVGLCRQGSLVRLPARTREVFDVSGAGDTVVAIMALAMGAQLDIARSMELANIAAGLVVEKWGTQPVFANELFAAAVKDGNKESFCSAGKICSAKQLKALLGPPSARQKEVVFTNGCFDILHAGHVSYLEAARSLGQKLVVGVNSDASLKRLKGETRPIIPQEQRMAVLAGLGCVDYVVCFDEDTPEKIIKELAPDVLCKGADYEISEIVGARSVLESGGRVQQISFIEGLSTSDIISRVKALS